MAKDSLADFVLNLPKGVWILINTDYLSTCDYFDNTKK